MSWYDSGMPVINAPEVLCTAELIKRLYELPGCGMGGPLHAIVDDYNTGDEHVLDSDYFGVRPGRTIETYLSRHRWVPPMGHVYDDELNCSEGVADLCRLILASMRRMPEPWRAAAIAWADGTIARNLPILVDNPQAACEGGAEQVDDFVADLRRWIEQGEVSGPKACVPIPCPDFEPVNLRTRYAPLFANGPTVRLDDVPEELRPLAEQYIEEHAPRITREADRIVVEHRGLVDGVIHPGPGMRFAPNAKITGPLAEYAKVNEDGTLRLGGVPLLGDAPGGAPLFRDSTTYTVHPDGSVETHRWTAEDVLRATTAPDVDVAAVLDDPRQIRPVYPDGPS